MKISGSTSVVASYPAIHCDSSEYLAVYPVIVVLLVAVVIFVPCGMTFYLWRHRRSVVVAKRTRLANSENRAHPPTNLQE
jgi:hypothetical protein